MSWLLAAPVALVAVAWVLGPGLVAGYALGLRGVTAWGIAPVLSIATAALAAVMAERLQVPWSPVVALAGAIVLAAGAVLIQTLARRIRPNRGPTRARDGWQHGVGAAVGLAASAVIGVATAVRAMREPDALSQTYDAVFHYNAVAEILASADASSLTVGTLADPAARIAFYPAAWHDLVSLVVLSTGASVPLASNAVAVVVAAVVWPLSSLVLVRQVVGRSVAAALLTPVVAVGFAAFPWTLMTFGVLWPNLLGLALVPVGVAVVVTLSGLARESALTSAQAATVAGMSAVALALAHPNALFSLAAVSAAPALWWLAAQLRILFGSGRWVLAGALLVTAVGAATYVSFLLLVSPLFADVRAFDWPAYQSPAQAAGEVALNATNGKDAAWAISLVVVIGALAAGAQRSTRWLIAAHLASGMLFILASSLDTPLSAALTGIWYNDSNRLAAMIPITGVPLGVLGLLAAGGWAASKARGHGSFLDGVLRPGTMSVGALALLVMLSSGMYVRDHAEAFADSYPLPARASLMTPQQRDFLERVGDLTPPGALVAQNPWNGSALLPALTGTEVLFPHLAGSWTADQLYLASHLDDALVDRRVCPIVRRLGVDYLLTGEARFWMWDGRTRQYEGFEPPTRNHQGFVLEARGPMGQALYRITACGTTASF